LVLPQILDKLGHPIIKFAMADFKIVIIGGGVVGLAIAARLSERHKNIVLLEKNTHYGMETSSRNSEVIHAGIYYPTGSLKAKLCVEGMSEIYSVCKANNIPHRRVTKLITASVPEDLPRIEKIFKTGTANGAELKMLSAGDALKLEPNIRSVGAIFSPNTGILSAHGLMDYYFHTAKNNGAVIQERCKVVGIGHRNGEYVLDLVENGAPSRLSAEIVINSAGLNADEIAAMVGIDIDAANYRLVYCKGSYFSVVPAKWAIVTRLVYPAPPMESLGVHALMDIGGRLRFGPDLEYLDHRNPDFTVDDSKRFAFAASIQNIIPSLTEADLVPDMCGIRPKLQRKGEPAKDFVIAHEKERGLQGFINLIGIESPGLTASPAIARYVESLL